MDDRSSEGGVAQVGAYRIEGPLGRGGMGEVFLAWDERLGRHVAIKRIRSDKLAGEGQRARFRREARAVARLSHPAIVQIYDILEHPEGDDIVMERVEGESLVDLLSRGPLELPLALRLAREIADGLAEAHAKGLVHRDLKAENVLVSSAGHAKILDFGLARDLAPSVEELAEAQTTSGMLLGTAHAMSPEQATGQRVDPRSDLFALGSLIYHVLTGEAPFRGASLADSLRRVVSVEPPPLGERRRDVPPALERLVGRLLAKDPAERPQSARLVMAEIDALLEDLSGARPGSPAEDPDSETTRREGWRETPAAVKAVVVMAGLLLIAVSILAIRALREEDRQRQALQASEARRQQAEELVGFAIGDLRQKLQPVGQLELLAEVGDRAMEHFTDVPAESLADEALEQRARALHQVGQLRFGRGRLDAAAAAFGAALESAEHLVRREPAEAGRRFELGQSQFWMGFVSWQQRRLDPALRHFEAYREVSRELVARDPAREKWQLELAFSHSNVASILEELGELPGAVRELEAGARILEMLTTREGADPQLGVELAHVYAKLGHVLRRSGLLTASLARFRAALESHGRARAARPESVELLRFWGVSNGHVGDVLWLTGDLEGALEGFRTDLEVGGRLLEQDPGRLGWQNEQGVRHGKLGRALLAAGDAAGAQEHLEKERALTDALVEQAPDHGRWRFSRARNLLGWALWHAERRDSEAARRELVSCRAILEELLEVSGEHPEYQLWLARALIQLGLAHQGLGDGSRATRAWAEGLELAQALVRAKPAPSHLDALARLLMLLERPAEAAPWIEELAAMGYREPTYAAFLARRAPDPVRDS